MRNIETARGNALLVPNLYTGYLVRARLRLQDNERSGPAWAIASWKVPLFPTVSLPVKEMLLPNILPAVDFTIRGRCQRWPLTLSTI